MIAIACLDPAEIPLPKRPVPEVEYLTNEEVRRVLDSINITSYAGIRLRALVELLLSTGMRISEALSLDRTAFEAGETEVQIIGKGRKPKPFMLQGGEVQADAVWDSRTGLAAEERKAGARGKKKTSRNTAVDLPRTIP